MANHKSALKAHRQSLKRRERNRAHKARMRTAVKQFRSALAGGDVEVARGLLGPTLALVDRTAKLCGIHDRTASRAKSRLQRALNKATA